MHDTIALQRVDSIIIMVKNGNKPYARVVPLKHQRRRVPGHLKGKVGRAFFKPLPEEVLRAWENEAASVLIE
jgi:hypothetical protein